jgi:leucyl aminopeptidase
MLRSVLTFLLSISHLGLGSPFLDGQEILAPSLEGPYAHSEHVVDNAILAALRTHSDPVAALLSLQPEIAADLAEPRLLHVFGQEKPQWLTEGDKLRLHSHGKKFMDITDHEELYAQQSEASWAGKACKSASSTST